MKTLNERLIKTTGALSILDDIEVDKSYRVGLDVEIYSQEQKSRQDGTYDVHYKAAVVGGEVLKETGEVIKAKDKKRQSQKLRQAIYAIGEDYDKVMSLILANLEDIIMEYGQH